MDVGYIIFILTLNDRTSQINLRFLLQSITLAARARGLETITQASIIHILPPLRGFSRPTVVGLIRNKLWQEALAKYQLILRQYLPISDEEIVMCGMSMGYPDLEKIAQFSAKQPKREVSDIIQFFGM